MIACSFQVCQYRAAALNNPAGCRLRGPIGLSIGLFLCKLCRIQKFGQPTQKVTGAIALNRPLLRTKRRWKAKMGLKCVFGIVGESFSRAFFQLLDALLDGIQAALCSLRLGFEHLQLICRAHGVWGSIGRRIPSVTTAKSTAPAHSRSHTSSETQASAVTVSSEKPRPVSTKSVSTKGRIAISAATTSHRTSAGRTCSIKSGHILHLLSDTS